VCPCAPTPFPLSIHHTPCRLRKAKAHKHKELVKRYFARKARWLVGKANLSEAVEETVEVSLSEAVEETVEVSLSEAVEETVEVSSDESEAQVHESPERTTPIKPIPALLLSPATSTKIAKNKAAALERRAAIEAGLKCAICAVILSVQNSDKLCASCLLDVSKEDSEPEGNSREESVTGVVKKEKKLKKAVSEEDSEPEGNSREESVTGVVKKEKKLKKAVAALRIDFEAKAIAIKEDGSKTKSRVKKTPKKFDA
jgi:hypothetical protein